MGAVLTKLVMPILIPLIQKLLKENYAIWGDRFFDLLEDAIQDSETTLDDLTLPLIKTARVLLGIPDLPDDIEVSKPPEIE